MFSLHSGLGHGAICCLLNSESVITLIFLVFVGAFCRNFFWRDRGNPSEGL